jgi:hypothetical protein
MVIYLIWQKLLVVLPSPSPMRVPMHACSFYSKLLSLSICLRAFSGHRNTLGLCTGRSELGS